MKLSLLDASEGRIARSLGDQLLHYCYRFDPRAGAYTMEAMAVMRIAGGLTVLGLVVLIGGLFAWEKRKKRLGSPADAAGTAPRTRPTIPEHTGTPRPGTPRSHTGLTGTTDPCFRCRHSQPSHPSASPTSTPPPPVKVCPGCSSAAPG
jgi:hypothetical protein